MLEELKILNKNENLLQESFENAQKELTGSVNKRLKSFAGGEYSFSKTSVGADEINNLMRKGFLSEEKIMAKKIMDSGLIDVLNNYQSDLFSKNPAPILEQIEEALLKDSNNFKELVHNLKMEDPIYKEAFDTRKLVNNKLEKMGYPSMTLEDFQKYTGRYENTAMDEIAKNIVLEQNKQNLILKTEQLNHLFEEAGFDKSIVNDKFWEKVIIDMDGNSVDEIFQKVFH
eukprot:Pgem_evm1s13940